jgi:hypothetical protein
MRARIDFICFLIVFIISTSLFAQRPPRKERLNSFRTATTAEPTSCYAIHNVGQMALTINSNGIIGWPSDNAYACYEPSRVMYACRYPKLRYIDHLFRAGLWVGAVVGIDTLVSVSYDGIGWNESDEMWAAPPPEGDIQFHSTVSGDESVREGAVSEQDYIAVYNDSLYRLSRDYFGSRPHRPLYIEVTQRSYAWSYGFAEDFVIFDVTMSNVGQKRLEDLYIGLLVDAEIRLGLICSADSYGDDLVGYLTSAPSIQGCGFEDSVGIMWAADADGDPFDGEYVDTLIRDTTECYKSARSISGISLLNPAASETDLSFNWWNSRWWQSPDFGPRLKNNYRNFKTGGLGIPWGDVNKYHVLSNGEKDYDLADIGSIEFWDPDWMEPSDEVVRRIGRGTSVTSLISFGPYRVFPGEDVHFTFAYVAGEDFHTDPTNVWNLPDFPKAYYENVDFSDLAKNAAWAKWVYDNPGFDTDGDGYYGKFRLCVHDSVETDTGWIASRADTFWYEGDGIPDFRGAMAPAAPYFWVTPFVGGFHVRLNGSRSETEHDVFSNLVDFEGYHIWLGRDEREYSYSLMAGYDIDNYDKWVWNKALVPRNYELQDVPFTLEELRCLYGKGDDPCSDSTFKPHRYTRANPYQNPDFPDSLFYFTPHHFNASQPGVTSPIRKVYPDEPNPAMLPIDSLTPDRYTEEGHLKYYEYEFTIENLLPTVPYWINVTAFDFGSPAAGLNPLETSKTVGAVSAYVYGTEAQLLGQEKEVYVYPNPYRKDGEYRIHGYEGRTFESLPNEKVRAIHFANLPPKCKIRIHTIDGDLVRTIEHDYAPDDPWAHHDEWNLITRNRNIVMSGLYYWTVEDESGHVQMGKLVIIM